MLAGFFAGGLIGAFVGVAFLALSGGGGRRLGGGGGGRFFGGGGGGRFFGGGGFGLGFGGGRRARLRGTSKAHFQHNHQVQPA